MLADFSSTLNNRATLSSLLYNLAIKDDASYQIINTDIFMHYQKSIGEILDKLISNAVFKFNPSIKEWIFAVPLLHFLMKKCVPFEQLEGISWDDDDCTGYAMYMNIVYLLFLHCMHTVACLADINFNSQIVFDKNSLKKFLLSEVFCYMVY